MKSKNQKEYEALVEAKKKGKLPRALFVRGMLLENKLKTNMKNTKSRPTVTHITIERNPPYIVIVQGDAGARNGAYEYSELFDDLGSARAYVNAESDKLVKENKKNVVRRVENL
jgi:hypothetical protein